MAIAAVGVILFIASVINGDSANLEGQVIAGEGFEAVKNIMSVAVIAPFFLFGFDVIPQVAEEINIPLSCPKQAKEKAPGPITWMKR